MAGASLREFQRALDSTDEIELRVIGRRSGRELRHPVWFVLEGNRLYLVPVKGSDTEWYKNLHKTPAIALVASGVEWRGSARRITDPTRVADLVEKLRGRYGEDEVEKYYCKLDVAIEVPLEDTSSQNPQ
jgi:hypothetical protein